MSVHRLSKLGIGPFTIDAVLAPDCTGWDFSGPIEGDPERCACCGKKGLRWRVVVTDQPTGKSFFLGRTCASKASDLDLAKLEELAARAERTRLEDLRYGNTERGKAFRAWAAEQPHPKGWTGRSLLNDLDYWYGRSRKTALGRSSRTM